MDQPLAKLYVVAIPIGNLEDITLRALRILREVDLIACEDTRMTRKLLHLLDLPAKPLVSYHDIGEEKQAQNLVKRLEHENLQMALVSDAGTPCIADPGFRLVAAAKKRGIVVSPIPGPSSSLALASASGLPTDRLLFVGFLPSRAGELRGECQSWALLKASILAFESPKRLAATLALLAELYPAGEIAIGRELTKVYEEIPTLALSEALSWWQQHAKPKGEVSLMIYPKTQKLSGEALAALITAKAKALIARGFSQQDLLVEFKDWGLAKKELYKLLLALKERD